MFDLAQFSNGKAVSLSVISKRQSLPLSYLEQIMLDLKKAELVTSVRGAYGGYKLNRELDEITVKDIFDVLEGPIVISECVDESNVDQCKYSSYCVTKLIYKELAEKLAEVTSNITLQDMLNDNEKLNIKELQLEI